MNAPPFPMNPSVGQIAGGWVWNGTAWVPNPTDGQTANVQVFIANGTYMPTTGMVTCVVECIGGGGGSGGAGTSGPTLVRGGGGGGSGGYSRKTLPAGLVLGGVIVTIGAGGTAQTGATGSITAGAGGMTTFGGLCSANGGGGGNLNDGPNGAGKGGSAATPGVGDVAFGGAPGQCGLTQVFTAVTNTVQQGGQGGWIFGGAHTNGTAQALSAVGVNGDNGSGAGATGAIVNQVTTADIAGGAGGSGICIVTEYISAWDSGSGSGGPVPITDGSCIGWGPSQWR